jgi:PPP family 3-phenylpropionic acid transporter
MTSSRPADDFALRLAVFYACLFIVGGIQLPFFPLWLQARGLEPEAIGIVLTMPVMVRILAVPVLNRAVDRTGNLRGGLIVAAIVSTFSFAIVGFAQGFVAILLAVGFSALASGPLNSLADAYALKGLGIRAYGPIRLWGSAAFIAANLGAGLLLAIVAVDHLIWLIVAAFALLSVVSFLLHRLETAPAVEVDQQPVAGHLWQSPEFLALAAAASLIQASHAIYYGFSAVDWTAKSFSSTSIGTLWALGVIAEIVLFALSGRLSFNPAMLIGLGAAGAVIRWIAMAFDPPMILLPLLQCLHGLSFGATHLGAIQYVARASGGRRTAAAQGDLTTILAIGNAAATGASGLLYGALGDSAYAIMAATAALGGACLVLALSLSRR